MLSAVVCHLKGLLDWCICDAVGGQIGWLRLVVILYR